MAALFSNLYHLRQVASASSSPCVICYKSVDRVLVTPDKKDFFYVCPKHLEDRNFATAISDEKSPIGTETSADSGASAQAEGPDPVSQGAQQTKTTVKLPQTNETEDRAVVTDRKPPCTPLEVPKSRIFTLHKWATYRILKSTEH